MNIGTTIEYIRKKAGYSREFIKEGICDESTIYRIEKGDQIPRLDILQKICNKLNVSIDFILSLDNVDTSYNYINKVKKLCREFLYQHEFTSIRYLITDGEAHMKNNPSLYDDDFCRFLAWLKAILVHKIDQQPKKAEALFRELLNSKIINELDINIANSLALVLIELKNYDDASHILRSGMKASENLPFADDKSLYPRISYNLSYIHYIFGEYDKSIDICYRLQYYLLSNHLLYSKGELCHLLGITFEKKGELDNSYHYLKKATAIFFAEEKNIYYIRTSLAFSEICFQMENYREGITTIENAMDRTNTLDDNNLIEQFFEKIRVLKEQYSIPQSLFK